MWFLCSLSNTQGQFDAMITIPALKRSTVLFGPFAPVNVKTKHNIYTKHVQLASNRNCLQNVATFILARRLTKTNFFKSSLKTSRVKKVSAHPKANSLFPTPTDCGRVSTRSCSPPNLPRSSTSKLSAACQPRGKLPSRRAGCRSSAA